MADPNDLNARAERRQLLLVGLGVVVVGALLALAYFAYFRTNYVVLFARLRPADASAVVAELQKDKTPYRLADKGATVLVPEQLADAARLNVVSTDIPLKGAVGFELFNKSDMGLTDFAQKINYQRALQGELARTIMALNGVDSARVHLSLPEQTIFQRDHSVAKASVTVTMQLGSALSPAAVNGIQHLVASAVADLDAGDVVVLDAAGEVISAPAPAASPSDPHVQQKLAIEQYYAGKIREGLEKAGLADRVQVTVLAMFSDIDTAAAPGDAVTDTQSEAPAQPDIFSSSFVPQARRFGLRAILTASPALSSDDRGKATNVAREAIAFDGEKGDDIAFRAPAPDMPWAASVSPGISHVVAPTAVSSEPRANEVSRLILVALLAALATAGVALCVMAWRRRLSPARRAALVAQLTARLDTLEGGA